MPENVVPEERGYGGPPPPPKSIKDQLKEISDKIKQFEAEKNEEKKTALAAFDAQNDTAIDKYRKAYPGLRDRWCTQQRWMESLYHSVVSSFPSPPWKDWRKEIVPKCICVNLGKVAADEQALEKQKQGAKGPNELARDQAKDRLLAAKKRIDDLLANTENAKSLLDTNEKLIDTVKGLLGKPDQATALYLFWFKLLPAHVQLRPADVSDECKKFGAGDAPAELCKPDAPPPPDSPRALPWLMPPDNYPGALLSAWTASVKATSNLTEKEAAFQKAPDSIDALGKKLDQLKKSVDDDINKCLKEATPPDTCCVAAAH